VDYIHNFTVRGDAGIEVGWRSRTFTYTYPTRDKSPRMVHAYASLSQFQKSTEESALANRHTFHVSASVFIYEVCWYTTDGHELCLDHLTIEPGGGTPTSQITVGRPKSITFVLRVSNTYAAANLTLMEWY
jgi:hypothetical protein